MVQSQENPYPLPLLCYLITFQIFVINAVDIPEEIMLLNQRLIAALLFSPAKKFHDVESRRYSARETLNNSLHRWIVKRTRTQN